MPLIECAYVKNVWIRQKIREMGIWYLRFSSPKVGQIAGAWIKFNFSSAKYNFKAEIPGKQVPP